MKTLCDYLRSGLWFAPYVAFLTLGTATFAQTTITDAIPVVTVQATGPVATSSVGPGGKMPPSMADRMSAATIPA
ncbi:MAG: hypothetical protein ACLQSR_14730 [Limisphaerales bacterium]